MGCVCWRASEKTKERTKPPWAGGLALAAGYSSQVPVVAMEMAGQSSQRECAKRHLSQVEESSGTLVQGWGTRHRHLAAIYLLGLRARACHRATPVLRVLLSRGRVCSLPSLLHRPLVLRASQPAVAGQSGISPGAQNWSPLSMQMGMSEGHGW